jgi:small subunit ribosomal protein S11
MQQMVKEKKKRMEKTKAEMGKTHGFLYITLTKNNTIITLTDPKHQVLTWSSCRNCGFKGSEKSTEMATVTTAEEMGLRAKDLKMKRVFIVFRGGGRFKRAALQGVARSKIKVSGFVVQGILPYNGCRLKKRRRI